MPYILEAQQFYPDGFTIHPEWNGLYEHIGYMNKIFTTKKEACAYYDKYNKNMRKLNANNTLSGMLRSDYDLETKILYVVREYGGEYLKLPPFEKLEKNVVKQPENYVVLFINERIKKSDNPNAKPIKKTSLIEEFKIWFQIEQAAIKIPKADELYEYMNKKFGQFNPNLKGWSGVEFIRDEEEDFLDVV
jgi:triacylglycerol esterase/lipase EstA (alpha/beta hydrolase family)